MSHYAERLRLHQAAAVASATADTRLATAKVVVFFLLLALAWLAWVGHHVSGLWLWPPAALMVGLFFWHDRVLQRLSRQQRWAAAYQHGLARLENRWTSFGSTGDRFRDPAHPYADDLDLFGTGSLFHLLCVARTPMGEATLANWLRQPASPAVIAHRQRQVADGRDRLDLREQLVALGDGLKQRTDPDRLASWAASPVRPFALSARMLYAMVAVLTLGAVVYALSTGQLTPLIALVVLQALLLFQARHRVEAAIHNIGANGEGLTIFSAVLDCIPDLAPPLRPGPGALRQLARLADWIDACDTLLGKVLDFTVLYSLQLAGMAESWRQRYAAAMADWLAAVGEFEATASLATYAFEHPADPFPELLDAPTPIYAAEELAHPLLPEGLAVRNSLRFDADTALLIVSGSNMAGKSTLLRAVGCNAVLAQMGAPVRARRLGLTPLQLGTRLRTSDSLQQGRSGFYAEILRLRQVFELHVGPLPLLYLFDELLEGTNSHDRVRGAQGLLQALLRHPTLGMVTTHDLALAAMAADLGPRVRNVHLEDQIEGNDVHFDHKLRDGQVTKSNALALMRIVGLEV